MNVFGREKIFCAVAACLTATLVLAAKGDVETQPSLRPDLDEGRLQKLWPEKKALMTAPGENLFLPLAFWEDGSLKARLSANRAQMLDLDYIFAEGVRIEQFNERGESDGVLVAEDCLFSRAAKIGYCKGKVSVLHDGDVVRGCGVFFAADERYVKILGAGEIRTKKFGSSFGRLK